jgi:hypothetical protein
MKQIKHFEHGASIRSQMIGTVRMSKLSKIMLALMIANFVAAGLFLTGLVNVSNVSALYVTFPVGATCYGLFLIAHILEKEVAVFDADHHRPGGDLKTPDHYESAEYLHSHESHEPIKA